MKDIINQKFYLKLIKFFTKSKIKEYFKILWVAPFNLVRKLEADNAGRIFRLIKWIALVEILKEQRVNNTFEDIEPKFTNIKRMILI